MRIFKNCDCKITGEQYTKWFASRSDIRQPEYVESQRVMQFRWSGMWAALRGLENYFSTDHVTTQVISPVRLDLHVNGRKGAAYQRKDVEEALKQIVPLRVTPMGSGVFDVWTRFQMPLYDAFVEAVDGLRLDVEIRSHDLMTYNISAKEGTSMDPVVTAMQSIKGVVMAESTGKTMRVLVRKNSVDEKAVQAALAPFKIEAKRAGK